MVQILTITLLLLLVVISAPAQILTLAHGGTNQPTWVAGRCVRVANDGTKLEVAAADCGTGGGTPGGSDTQVQWNNSTAFGGIANLTTDGTNLTKLLLFTPVSVFSITGQNTLYDNGTNRFYVNGPNGVLNDLFSYNFATESSAASTGGVVNLYAQVVYDPATASAAQVEALSGNAYYNSSQNWVGILSAIDTFAGNAGTGTVAYMEGVHIEGNQNYGGGTVTNNYGLRVMDQRGISGTKNAAIQIEDQGTGANDYSIYSAGGKSYFAGTVDAGALKVAGGGAAGKVLIGDGTTFVPGDPLVQGVTAHDAVGTSTNPVAIGGYASAAAPSDVSADGDIARTWHLRNGSPVVNLAAAGALVGATSNALDINIKSGSIGNTAFSATQGTSPWVTSITTWAAGTLGAMANYGTTPGAVLVPGVNAYITNSPAVTITSGTTAVTQATGTNLHAVIDTGSTTAVTQATGTNLHAVMDTGSTTSVTQATASSLNATVVGTGTFATQAAATIADGADVTLGAKTDAKSTATDATSVTIMQVLKEISAMEQAPASRAVTNTGTFATQSVITAASGAIASGAVASGAVASGAFASGAISDGADVTLGAKADAKSTATDATPITAMQVLKQISASAQAPPSQAVTNTGTFATQSAITAASGSIASGAVASGAIASGAVASGAFAAGSISDGADVTLGAKTDAKSTATDATSVTVMQVLKEISAMEQAPASRAVTNTGTFAVQSAATLAAETTKVIGTVNIAASQTIAVTQATGTNLHAVIDSGTVTVGSALPTGSNTVGKVNVLGNAGAVFDGATAAAVPANAVAAGFSDGTNTRIPVVDPCGYSTWTYYYVSVAANTQIAGAAGASKNYYICQMAILPAAAATTVNLVSSATAGNACATSTTALLTGGTTAALGATVAANGGFVLPSTGRAWAVTQATNHAFCIFASAAVTGVIAYAGPL